MPLLTLVTREAVDEDYVQAARERASGQSESTARISHRGAAAVTLAFGLLVALAAVQTARNADVQEASRDALIDRIDQRRADVAALDDRIDALEEQIAQLRDTGARFGAQLAQATVELRALQLSSGFVAVHGPGLRFTVSDNPDGSADGRVRATDLRLLVNGLWEAGAEAIAVNGRRLTALSAIVNSDIAIVVNQSPLSPPYVVSAIGEVSALQSGLPQTTTGAQFQALAAQFGFVVDRENEEDLVLPAAPNSQLRLRHAQQGSSRPDQEEAP